MKKKDYFVYLLSNKKLDYATLELENILKDNEIKLIKVFNKYDKKTLLLATDIIIILDDEIILNNEFIETIHWLICQNRRYILFKWKGTDVTEIYDFLKLPPNKEIKDYKTNDNFLFNLLLSLNSYYLLNFNLYNKNDKELSQDVYFIKFLDYYVNYNIINEVQIRMLLPITSNEYEKYRKYITYFKMDKMNDVLLVKYFPNCYKQIYNKKNKELDIYTLIEQITSLKDQITIILNNITFETLNIEFKNTYTALRENKKIDNHFVKILILLNAVRIIDNEMYAAVSMKCIKEIKNYLSMPFTLKNKIKLDITKEQFYILKPKQFNEKIENIKDINKYFNIYSTNEILLSTFVIVYVTKESVNDLSFLENLKIAIYNKKKILIIYIEKCNFNLELEYLIKYYDDMYYWAYNRMDIFYEKYLLKIDKIIKSNYIDNQVSMIVNLK